MTTRNTNHRCMFNKRNTKLNTCECNNTNTENDKTEKRRRKKKKESARIPISITMCSMDSQTSPIMINKTPALKEKKKKAYNVNMLSNPIHIHNNIAEYNIPF